MVMLDLLRIAMVMLLIIVKRMTTVIIKTIFCYLYL